MNSRNKIFSILGACAFAIAVVFCALFSIFAWKAQAKLAETSLENLAHDAADAYAQFPFRSEFSTHKNISNFLRGYLKKNEFVLNTTLCMVNDETGAVFEGPNQTLSLPEHDANHKIIFKVTDTFSNIEYVVGGAACRDGRIFIMMPAGDFYLPRLHSIILIWTCGAIILVLVLGVSYFIAKLIARDIRMTSAALERLKCEDYSHLPRMKPFSGDGEKIYRTIQTIIREQDRRKNEQEKNIAAVQRSQKLESIGILAGGIAHDFNNLLTAIRGNLQLALMFSESPETRRCLADCEDATIRAAALTNQLLTFSAGGKPVKSVVSIPELVESFASFVLRGSRIKYTMARAEKVLPVEADSGQFGQAVDNIVINAAQSMPDGGKIEIRIDNYYHKPDPSGTADTFKAPALSVFPRLGVSDSDAQLKLPAGAYVKISIKDSGCGIIPENLEKIFDPFFTTKKTGNGLGLATTYEIIRKHGGFLCVCSEPGRGTEFRIYLPALPESDENSAGHNEQNAKRDQIYSGGGHVMIMDDRADIRALLTKMLTMMNCRCDSASDGDELIAKFKNAKANSVPYDVIFMDLTIPGGMGGKEAIGIIRSLDSEVKTVVASGYSNDPVIADFMEHGFNACLQKPFKIADVSIIMHRLMKK